MLSQGLIDAEGEALTRVGSEELSIITARD